jgi:hypothetical protein
MKIKIEYYKSRATGKLKFALYLDGKRQFNCISYFDWRDREEAIDKALDELK